MEIPWYLSDTYLDFVAGRLPPWALGPYLLGLDRMERARLLPAQGLPDCGLHLRLIRVKDLRIGDPPRDREPSA